MPLRMKFRVVRRLLITTTIQHPSIPLTGIIHGHMQLMSVIIRGMDGIPGLV